MHVHTSNMTSTASAHSHTEKVESKSEGWNSSGAAGPK